MRLYNEKLSRLSENKRNQANIEDTERLAEKYNWQLEELKTRGIARQKERLKTRGDSLKKEAEILLEQIEEHNILAQPYYVFQGPDGEFMDNGPADYLNHKKPAKFKPPSQNTNNAVQV